jgi:hypothetical protein
MIKNLTWNIAGIAHLSGEKVPPDGKVCHYFHHGDYRRNYYRAAAQTKK